QTLPGISGPLGFFDLAGFCGDNNGADGSATLGKVKFYREVELKHGRVAMLASLGFLVGENFHPLFGGNIDVPSYVAFQQTPLQTFWPAVVFVIASLEVFSVFTFEDPNVEGWAIRADHEPGTLGSNNRRWDPLGLAPSDPAEFKAMQTKELNNGRLAMIAIAGMIAQELVT
ncbi:light harvesting protein, partial [Emiliania huxleyi CCMP1516]|uniref:Light harvesting protein n=2 Tax=Emiliania huxleyi TaxID=2903 RepID=A0A0D3I344_EMIH1